MVATKSYRGQLTKVIALPPIQENRSFDPPKPDLCGDRGAAQHTRLIVGVGWRVRASASKRVDGATLSGGIPRHYPALRVNVRRNSSDFARTLLLRSMRLADRFTSSSFDL